MLNKFTIIGLIIGSAISLLGVSSMVDSLSNPNEVQEDSQTFGVGEMDKIQFNAPENSSQSIMVTGDSFDIKISTPDSSNNIDQSFKGKANLSWTSVSSGETIIMIQNTGDNEFIEQESGNSKKKHYELEHVIKVYGNTKEGESVSNRLPSANDLKQLHKEIQKLELALQQAATTLKTTVPNRDTGEVPLRTGIAQALLDKETPKPKIQSKSKKLFTKSLGKTKIEVNPNVDIGIASGGKNTGSGRNLN